ncbi:MAG: hypothetical protein HYW24_02750 [Candidatus Aenigmarchaeota archaeon]|nr:hypothetical protein [Candidatus Aenigmarchaeota archaeon]
MNGKLLIIMSVVAMVFLAGCAKAPAAAPTISSGNVEESSSNVETTSNEFVNDATPTSDQVVPDLT